VATNLTTGAAATCNSPGCAAVDKCNANGSGGYTNCGTIISDLTTASSGVYLIAPYTVTGEFVVQTTTGASFADHFSDGSHFYTGKDGFLGFLNRFSIIPRELGYMRRI
jgi:hypothetical protein